MQRYQAESNDGCLERPWDVFQAPSKLRGERVHNRGFFSIISAIFRSLLYPWPEKMGTHLSATLLN